MKIILKNISFFIMLITFSQIHSMSEPKDKTVHAKDVIHFLMHGDRNIKDIKLSTESKIALLNKLVSQKEFIPALKLLWSEKDEKVRIEWLTQKSQEGHAMFMIELAKELSQKKSLEEQRMSLNWYHLGSLIITISIQCHYNNNELTKSHNELDEYAGIMFDDLVAIDIQDMDKEVLNAMVWACRQVKEMTLQDPSWVGYSKPEQEIILDLIPQTDFEPRRKASILISENYLISKGFNQDTYKNKRTLKDIIENLKFNSRCFKKTQDRDIVIKENKIAMKFKTLDNVD